MLKLKYRIKDFTQSKANLRICGCCCRIFWANGKPCPVCGFASYGAIWAVGWKATLKGWITKSHNKSHR